ncbi:hypothetical protein AbraIFM66950_004703 [Aspergillus brasiliensis]|nr:hypothetical protein AbraIFM66950_004703 [Aspergillus brasiliensis]
MIPSLRDGGLKSPLQVLNGQADLGIYTPGAYLAAASKGKEILNQVQDRMMLAVNPSLGVRSFAEIRERNLPLRIAVSNDHGPNLIGYVSARILEAHGLDESTVRSWGGSWGKIMQEAITTPWWRELIESQALVPVPVEDGPMHKLALRIGFLLVLADIPDDVAYLLTWCLVETREVMEAQYRHIPLNAVR